MGKKAPASKIKAAPGRTSKPSKPKKAVKAAARPPKKAAAKPKPVRKAPPPKVKAAERRGARPAAAPAPRKASVRSRAAQSVAPVAEKRSKAVERLLALKANKKEEPAPRKEGYLIRAPKKTKQENLAATPRFQRRAAPAAAPVKPAVPAKAAGPAKKGVLRKRDVDELRHALEDERQRLIAQLAALDETAALTGPSDVNETVPGYSIHLAEYASENQVVETTLAQRALQAERLREIEEALQRVSHPGFGICRNCGNPISLERLKIKPSADFCVPCRQLKEQGRI